MVSGAFAAVFGAYCGKRRPTQVDWVAPLRPVYCSPPLWTTKTQKKSTAKSLHGQYMSLYTSNIGFWCFSGRFRRVLRWKCARHRCAAVTTAVLFFRRQKRNKMHGKVAAKTALVLTHVYKWFLVLLRPFSGRTAVKGGRLRWTR